MKFRIKVLLVSLLVLSVSLGAVGYLMIRKNYDLAMDNVLENAITENNLMQASIEYELLKDINNTPRLLINIALEEIGARVAGSILSSGSSFYIRYGTGYVYNSDNGGNVAPEELFEEMTTGRKNYIFVNEDGESYIYITSVNPVNDKNLYIVSKRNITNVNELLHSQIEYYRLVIVAVLVFAGGIMLVLSRMLTKPLERLNAATEEISRGNYTARTDIKTNDEVGLLADKFNDMAEAVDEHVQELNDMVKRREQFVADFTHEIKTPMTAIIGYADTIRSVELDRQELIMACNYIFSEGKRLENMSAKLFELIYLRSNNIEKNKLQVTNLADKIERVVAPILDSKGIELKCSVEPGIIRGDTELLVTSFVNIIDNARKASDENSVIELIGKQTEDKYELSVRDYGIGMTEEQKNKICDEFYMADKSRSRKEGGAGLGMSLVAIIFERHNAELLVESEPGKGTCMKVLFEKEYN